MNNWNVLYFSLMFAILLSALFTCASYLQSFIIILLHGLIRGKLGLYLMAEDW